jgi:hypothetical protein
MDTVQAKSLGLIIEQHKYQELHSRTSGKKLWPQKKAGVPFVQVSPFPFRKTHSDINNCTGYKHRKIGFINMKGAYCITRETVQRFIFHHGTPFYHGHFKKVTYR